MGELFEVLGALRFSNFEACPDELRGGVAKLKPAEGDIIEVPAEAACVSASVRRALLQNGIAEEVSLPLKRSTLLKAVDYMKHHRDNPAGEIITPLPSNDLMECGATRWDAKFVEVDKMALFEFALAASILDIAGLFFLTSAKAALLMKDKSSDKLRKEYNMTNDLPRTEEEAMCRELQAKGKAHPDDVSAEIAALAVKLQGAAVAAEKHGCLETHRTDTGAPAVDLKSWRHATWRAAVLLDWNLLASAPAVVKGDRDLIFGALMASQGAALQYASEEVRGDRKVVLEATKYAGVAFREASAELRNDRAFVLEAVAIHGAALSGASEALRGDRSLLVEAAKQGAGSSLQGATLQLRSDQDLVLELVTADPQAFRHAAEELREDKAFALRVAAASGRALQYMPARLQADREVVAAAVGENVAAALFAHTSRRAELGIDLPWDSQAQHKAQTVAAGVAEEGTAHGGLRMMDEGDFHYTHVKVQKSVQFSALSVMMGNMGQGNYTAANIFLDKLPGFQRPEIDAVTLMWGAVGNIGMRWKAFASADMLNATPEALLSISDASKVLQITCTKMDPPEWYAASMFDQYSREGILMLTAGGGSGGGYKPSEDTAGTPPIEWRADGLERGFLLGKGLDDQPPPPPARLVGVRGGAPLQNWPGLAGGLGGAAEAPSYELELGGRVQLLGLSSKNGTTGILIKCFADGKWKVRLEDGSGNALLKSCYLRAIAPASVVAKESHAAPPTCESRRARIEERRGRFKERGVVRRTGC
mmetsp:Transcript_30841/g.89704  ORF Transcript_30841/g.89704 Transcript_30841/m.89704 type:complete len:764 (+) Transcript_30841:135-2426(+)